MTKYRKGAVLRAWKDVAFCMKAERVGDDRATKLQAMWRRVDANKRLVKAAKLRRQYYFERQVKSLEKITNIETISELRTLIAKHEWVSSDIFFAIFERTVMSLISLEYSRQIKNAFMKALLD